jgi:ATP-dependent exoDNAse (exonuclease V) alpha subunit
VEVEKVTRFFPINGVMYSRTQYPLQNAFALTVHKTQSLSLDDISVVLDSSLFSPGQAYTAMSRGCALAKVHIIHLDPAAFLVDQEAVMECERLLQIWTKHRATITIRRQQS